jgi:hypothetical protein
VPWDSKPPCDQGTEAWVSRPSSCADTTEKASLRLPLWCMLNLPGAEFWVFKRQMASSLNPIYRSVFLTNGMPVRPTLMFWCENWAGHYVHSLGFGEIFPGPERHLGQHTCFWILLSSPENSLSLYLLVKFTSLSHLMQGTQRMVLHRVNHRLTPLTDN